MSVRSASERVSAGGKAIPHFGIREVKFKVWGKDATNAKFVVADVTRPIFNVSSLNQRGIRATFDRERSVLVVPGNTYELIHFRNLFYLPVKVLESGGCER